jgi:lipopolysaccharide export system protein LptA
MSPNSLTHSARLMLALILALPGIGNALPEDREQAIQIESNRAIRDEKAGTMVYIGNVELVQGSLKMLADRLEIYTLDNNEVERIIGYGTPAYVEQKPSADKPVIKARGDTIRYFVTEEKLQLEKNASIDQDGSVVTSNIIDYFIKDEIVKASGNEQRVRVVIPPRDENNEP